MDWLFERVIELGAWVALVLGIIFLCDSIWMLVQYVQNFGGEGAANYLANSGQAAAKFVGASLAMGILACIDHYVFDAPEQA